jgi:YD repeat-containing protein
MGKDAPKAPDPAKTAQGQYDWSKTAAKDQMNMNALDQTNPFGSSKFTRDANGNLTGINTSLSGALQGGANKIMGNVGAQAGLLPSGAFNPNVDGSAIRKAIQDNAMLAAQPEWNRQDDRWRIEREERGLPIGSEIDSDVAAQTGEARNQYLRGVANDSFIAGANEEQRQFGNALTQYKLPWETTASSLGLLQGLKGLTPQASQPQASIAAPNYSQLMQNQYEAQKAQYDSEMGGLGQLASTGLGLLTAPWTGGASVGLFGGLGGLTGPTGENFMDF